MKKIYVHVSEIPIQLYACLAHAFIFIRGKLKNRLFLMKFFGDWTSLRIVLVLLMNVQNSKSFLCVDLCTIIVDDLENGGPFCVVALNNCWICMPRWPFVPCRWFLLDVVLTINCWTPLVVVVDNLMYFMMSVESPF